MIYRLDTIAIWVETKYTKQDLIWFLIYYRYLLDFLEEHQKEVDKKEVVFNLSTATDGDPLKGYTIYIELTYIYKLYFSTLIYAGS